MLGEHLKALFEVLQGGRVSVYFDFTSPGDNFELRIGFFYQINVCISIPEKISGVNVGKFENEFVQKEKGVYKCRGYKRLLRVFLLNFAKQTYVKFKLKPQKNINSHGCQSSP